MITVDAQEYFEMIAVVERARYYVSEGMLPSPDGLLALALNGLDEVREEVKENVEKSIRKGISTENP